MRKYLGLAVALLAVASLLWVAPALAQPRPMPEDVYTPITKGFDLMRDGKYEAAQYEFETALKKDRYNPFALNNLAALMEKQGKMKEAMAFLTDAQAHAKEYFDKVEQTCFVGGLCAGVKPVKIVGPTSSIAPIIAENMKKLQDKMAAAPAKPEPSTPQPMEKKK